MIPEEDNNLFSPAPFFMIRTPLLPVDEFFRIIAGSDILACYSNEDLLREAIAIASPTLHQALQKNKEKRSKEREQILSSLLKYLLRMSTRSTPFGLFASVSQGSWGDATSIQFEHKNIRKRARPDMEWLMAAIQRISERPEILDFLPVQTNPLLYRSGNRLVLNYVRLKEGDKKQKKLSIGASPLVTAILANAEQSISIDQLVGKVMEKMADLDQLRVRGLVRKLVEHEVLVICLRPSLLTASPFDDLLAKLEIVQRMIKDPIPEIQKLNEIALEMSRYNSLEAGKGEELLLKIQADMGSLASSKHFLQVDATYQSEHLILNRAVGEELRKTAEVLWRFSYREKQTLQGFHAKFIEKYGLGRRVPLLELLSDEGLGVPDIYAEAPLDNHKGKEWSKWFKQAWCKCLHEKATEICLTEPLIDKILGPCPKEKAPLSFDLYCEIISPSAAHLDAGDFQLSVFNNTWQGGSTFGRFIDILGVKTREALQHFYSREEQLEENVLFAESSYLPFPSRNANVCTYPNLRKHTIDLECNSCPHAIPLDEIMVGVLEERFYLSLKGKKEELVVMEGNVLNAKYSPIPLRFMRDVSRLRYSPLEIFSLRDLDGIPFVPRIRFNRSILAPAQWRIDLELLEASPKDGSEIIGEKFLKWAASWNLPRYVFMTYGDNRILLDYQKPEHLREIVSNLKKNEGVKLVEKIGQETGEWVVSSKGRHFSEFVVPFIKNKKFQPAGKPLNLPVHDLSPSSIRWKLPGSDWLFIKLYVPKENETAFLLQHLSHFANHLKEQGVIEGWFFIRYTDQSPHIRVRFRSDKDKILTALIPALHDWSLSLIEQKVIHDMNIGCYERELERYGGEEFIELAENFFCADASSAIELLGLMAEEKLSLPDFALAALSLIDLLKGLGLNVDEMMTLLKASASDQTELKGFRQIKNDLLQIGEALLNDSIADPDAELLRRAFRLRNEALAIYGEKLGASSHASPLIYNSLLHMHCNRLMGTQLNLEHKARLYACHTLQCISNKRK